MTIAAFANIHEVSPISPPVSASIPIDNGSSPSLTEEPH